MFCICFLYLQTKHNWNTNTNTNTKTNYTDVMENPSLLRFLVDMRGEDVSNRQVGLGLGLGLSLSLRLMCKGLLLYTGGVLLHADWCIR